MVQDKQGGGCDELMLKKCIKRQTQKNKIDVPSKV